ncbi:hypothetical protein RFL03_10295 [Streptococcus parasuis]|uniref:hypothetical protein n=1 Tax=Streptococcus parasuis TaxID=1501662 RepID=UPI002FCBBB96
MNKPKSGDVAVTKSRKDVTPVQQMSNPGPNKSHKTDFYVAPDGTTYNLRIPI